MHCGRTLLTRHIGDVQSDDVKASGRSGGVSSNLVILTEYLV